MSLASSSLRLRIRPEGFTRLSTFTIPPSSAPKFGWAKNHAKRAVLPRSASPFGTNAALPLNVRHSEKIHCILCLGDAAALNSGYNFTIAASWVGGSDGRSRASQDLMLPWASARERDGHRHA